MQKNKIGTETYAKQNAAYQKQILGLDMELDPEIAKARIIKVFQPVDEVSSWIKGTLV